MDLINTPKSKGGLGFFNIRKFTMAIKSAFILRYVKGTNDHWCDKVDQVLGVTPKNRSGIMCWGDLRFDRIINLKLICISNFFQAWKLIAKTSPHHLEARRAAGLDRHFFTTAI